MIDFSESFSPVVGETPKVLILGTLPGKESLRKKEYYANSRNLFWKIIYLLLDKSLETNYCDKTNLLKTNGIALWDVCQKAIRKSSLDSDIKDEKPNNLSKLLETYPTIATIAFNGQKAEKLYDKYFQRNKNINYMTLLSTSPANASYSYDQKIQNWKIVTKSSLSVV